MQTNIVGQTNASVVMQHLFCNSGWSASNCLRQENYQPNKSNSVAGPGAGKLLDWSSALGALNLRLAISTTQHGEKCQWINLGLTNQRCMSTLVWYG